MSNQSTEGLRISRWLNFKVACPALWCKIKSIIHRPSFSLVYFEDTLFQFSRDNLRNDNVGGREVARISLNRETLARYDLKLAQAKVKDCASFGSLSSIKTISANAFHRNVKVSSRNPVAVRGVALPARFYASQISSFKCFYWICCSPLPGCD
jgi:hypothetical protein